MIKDVYKTDVFRLARHLNERAGRELIPVSIIERPPSAELRVDSATRIPSAVRAARRGSRGLRRARPLARGAARQGAGRRAWRYPADLNLVVGIQDLGGAGLTCALSETAAAAGTGMAINLDLVPLREASMRPEEILASESQERMLLVVTPENLPVVLSLCARWGVLATAIGEVTEPNPRSAAGCASGGAAR